MITIVVGGNTVLLTEKIWLVRKPVQDIFLQIRNTNCIILIHKCVLDYNFSAWYISSFNHTS